MGPHPAARCLALLGVLAAGHAAWADGRIEKVVGAANGLAVLGDRTVTLLDGEGRLLGRCAAVSSPPERTLRRPIGNLDPDEALALAGFADDDDSTDAEDALSDEGIRPSFRRRAFAGSLPRLSAHDVTILPAGDAAFIATTDGVYRASADGCAPAGLGGHDVVAVAAGTDAVAVATETLLWRMDAAASVMTVAGGLPHRPRALAIADSGRIFVADDEGVLEAAPGADPVRKLDRPTEALAYCGGQLLVLADDGVYVESGATLVRAGDRPPVRTLACGGSSGPRFLAAGVGLWTSNDGRSWSQHPGALGQSVAAVAMAGERVWAVVSGELLLLADGSPLPVEQPQRLQPLATSGVSSHGLLGRTALSPSMFPWPRLTLAFAAEQTPVRAQWSVLLLLTFPLERRLAAGPPPAELGAELAQRDAALAEEQTALAARGADEEAAARSRALDQERTALR
jgi:hypothetical protein